MVPFIKTSCGSANKPACQAGHSLRFFPRLGVGVDSKLCGREQGPRCCFASRGQSSRRGGSLRPGPSLSSGHEERGGSSCLSWGPHHNFSFLEMNVM